MNHPVVVVIVEIGSWLFVALTWSAIMNTLAKDFGKMSIGLLNWVALELKPFFWPLAFCSLLDVFSNPESSLFERVMVTLGVIVSWVIVKNYKDDDRWKRRREKLAEKVSVVGGKLAITPA